MDDNPYKAPRENPKTEIRPIKARWGWELVIPLAMLIFVLLFLAGLLSPAR